MVRTPYADIPDHGRRWVDHALGSPVVSCCNRRDGLAPGCATRVLCNGGTLAFPRAVGGRARGPLQGFRVHDSGRLVTTAARPGVDPR